jgi:chaperonin cofactor prefoldin
MVLTSFDVACMLSEQKERIQYKIYELEDAIETLNDELDSINRELKELGYD